MEKKNQWNTGYWIVALLLLLSLQSYWQTAKTVEPVLISQCIVYMQYLDLVFLERFSP